MPEHFLHRFVDKVLFGRAYTRVHKGMDMPWLFLGRNHRVLFHDPLICTVIAQHEYPGDNQAILSAYVHIALDLFCSGSPFFKIQLKALAQTYSSRKRKRGFDGILQRRAEKLLLPIKEAAIKIANQKKPKIQWENQKLEIAPAYKEAFDRVLEAWRSEMRRLGLAD